MKKKKAEHCFLYVKQQLMNILIYKKSLKISKSVRSRNPSTDNIMTKIKMTKGQLLLILVDLLDITVYAFYR